MLSILKMGVSSKYSALVCAALFYCAVDAFSALNVTAEGDARIVHDDTAGLSGGLRLLSLSAKKTVADSKGDRLILFLNGELIDNFHEAMLHEAYARYKGPLSLWNVTAGRFALPFGTIQTYASSRFLWQGLEEWTTGLEADDGVMVSGVTSRLDYAVALSRGVGAHGGMDNFGKGALFTKITIPIDIEERFVAGISAMTGKVAEHHGFTEKHLGSIDASLSMPRTNVITELVGGKVSDHTFVAYSGLFDFSVNRLVEANLGYRYVNQYHSNFWTSYIGLTVRIKGFTIRGGYLHGNEIRETDAFAFQLYYQYSWNR